MFSLAAESVEGGKREKRGGGGKESPACFCPSTFVQMTGQQIRALKANGRQRNPAESKRVHERDGGNFHPQADHSPVCVLLSASPGSPGGRLGYHRGWNSGSCILTEAGPSAGPAQVGAAGGTKSTHSPHV